MLIVGPSIWHRVAFNCMWLHRFQTGQSVALVRLAMQPPSAREHFFSSFTPPQAEKEHARAPDAIDIEGCGNKMENFRPKYVSAIKSVALV